jgi:hypothetical protein
MQVYAHLANGETSLILPLATGIIPILDTIKKVPEVANPAMTNSDNSIKFGILSINGKRKLLAICISIKKAIIVNDIPPKNAETVRPY